MTAFTRHSPFVLAAALTLAAHAAALPADTRTELRNASHELDQAALLRYVATGKTEADHLLAARDDLREADPALRGALREKALRLEYDIGRDVGAAAIDVTAPQPDALGPISVRPKLDRADIGTLAQRSDQLMRQAQTG